MTDPKFLLYAYKGNQAAVDFVLLIAQVADVWDDLIDKDKPVADQAINDAFWNLSVVLPRNPFYRANMDELLPVMSAGILNWLTANKMERSASEHRALEIAHVIRYAIADIAIVTAMLTGGRDWALQVSPELRLRSQRSSLQEYLASLPQRDAGYEQETAEYLKHGMLLFQRYPLGPTDTEAADSLLAYGDPLPVGAVVVDMGCGVAGMERSTSRRDLAFVNVTNCAAQRAEIERVGLECLFADFHRTGIEDLSADMVLFAESFGYGDPKVLLAEAARILKPGGTCVIRDVAPSEIHVDRVLASWGYRLHSTEAIESMASGAGLSLIRFDTPVFYNGRWLAFMSNSTLMQRLHNGSERGGEPCVYVFRKLEAKYGKPATA